MVAGSHASHDVPCHDEEMPLFPPPLPISEQQKKDLTIKKLEL
jgi:hypothetical protein